MPSSTCSSLPGATDSGMFGRPTVMFAVGRNTKQPELAAQLLNFLLTDEEAAKILGRTRGAPAAGVQGRLQPDRKGVLLLDAVAGGEGVAEDDETSGCVGRRRKLGAHETPGGEEQEQKADRPHEPSIRAGGASVKSGVWSRGL